MVTFLALYRGTSFSTAEVVGVTTDPEIVAEFASRLLERRATPGDDPVLDQKHRAHRRALRLLRAEARRAVRGDQ